MNFLDLFAGIGGFRLGMESAGHECVGYVEIDKYARKSYEAIHNTEGEWTAHDITEVSNEHLRLFRGQVDVICGGFPCQAFSVAGKRGGFSDTRGTLFFDVARFAEQIKPRFLFLENVKGLLSHDKGKTFATILNTLDELGYDAEWQVLNSKNFGVPQNRERVFIIGHLRGQSRREVFPIGREGSEVTDEGTTNEGEGERICPTISTSPNHSDAPYVIKQVGNIDQHKRKRNNPQTGRVYDTSGISPALCTMQGGGLEPKIVEYDRKAGIGKELENAHTLNSSDWRGLNRNQKQNAVVQPVLTPDRLEKRQNGRRFKEDGEPAFTLNTQDKHGIYDGIKIRKLTPRECWRLQGFPDWAFDKAQEVNSNSQLYKQAGNSVTVNVIEEIAKRLEE